MHLLITYMERRNMSSTELSVVSGVNERTIKNMLKDLDCDPKKSTILRLALALNVHPQRLFFPDTSIMDDKKWEARRDALSKRRRDLSSDDSSQFS